MAKGKTSNKNQQQHYSAYKAENRFSSNKIRRMRRHMKNHPNDEQTAIALRGEPVYTRNRRGDNSGVSKAEKENDRKKTISKRKVYDSKGFVIKYKASKPIDFQSIKEKFAKFGIHRGRDINN